MHYFLIRDGCMITVSEVAPASPCKILAECDEDALGGLWALIKEVNLWKIAEMLTRENFEKMLDQFMEMIRAFFSIEVAAEAVVAEKVLASYAA